MQINESITGLPSDTQQQRSNESMETNLSVVSIPSTSTTRNINIAVIGCVHGELDNMYSTCQSYQKSTNKPIDLVICCGDFQSTRNYDDLQCMACPPRYRSMIDFHEYYSGQKQAPILTIFTHGNHEASNYLMELPYGGWVAPNIYYTGFVNILRFGDMKCGALGGIFHSRDYFLGQFESCPLHEDTMRSLYHTRHFDTWRLLQSPCALDCIVTHDWPNIAAKQGDVDQLQNYKKHFIPDIQADQLGSPFHSALLLYLKPLYWFSAHLHCKYVATFEHANIKSHVSDFLNSSTIQKHFAMCTSQNNYNTAYHVNANASPFISPFHNPTTYFLALDKILPHKNFMQVISHPIENTSPLQVTDDSSNDVTSNNSNIFSYDANWLSILRTTQQFTPRTAHNTFKVPPTVSTLANLQQSDELSRFKQYDGHLSSSIMAATTSDELFVSREELESSLPDLPLMLQPIVRAYLQTQWADTSLPTATGQLANIAITMPFVPTAHTSAYQHNHNNDHQNAPPPFQVNPQTVLFCNALRLLVPVYFEHTQWQSVKESWLQCIANANAFE